MLKVNKLANLTTNGDPKDNRNSNLIKIDKTLTKTLIAKMLETVNSLNKRQEVLFSKARSYGSWSTDVMS